jgi:hypothetical protein
MSRKSVQRFCDKDMPANKALKRRTRILEIATRFKGPLTFTFRKAGTKLVCGCHRLLTTGGDDVAVCSSG